MNPSGLTIATAVKAVLGESKSAYFVDKNSPAHAAASAAPDSASIKQVKIRKMGVRTSSASESSSPRTEWRQKFRLASDTLQLSAAAFTGHGFSTSTVKVRPSSAPRALAHQHVSQPPSLASHALNSGTKAHVAETQALVKGHSVKVTMYIPQSAEDTGNSVVPAPSLL